MRRRAVAAAVAVAAFLSLTLTGCGSDCPVGEHDVQTGSILTWVSTGKSLIPIYEPVYTCERN